MLRDAWADLALGGTCVGCARPGRLLCPACAQALPVDPAPAWPSLAPAGMALPVAAAPYEGVVREMVVGLKERRWLPLVAPLGEMLAEAVIGAVTGALAPGGLAPAPIVLVPVPSRPSSVRARGLDVTYALATTAARRLRRRGGEVGVARLLRTRVGLADQAGLDVAARQANLAGALSVPSAWLARLARRHPQAHVVICDDVLTTGATVCEAQRALEAVGLRVAAIATVAATPRRGLSTLAETSPGGLSL